MSEILRAIRDAPSIAALENFMALRPSNHPCRPQWDEAAAARRAQLLAPPPHYTATLNPATNQWYFTTPDPKRPSSSGWKHQGPCQRLADQVRDAAEAADS